MKRGRVVLLSRRNGASPNGHDRVSREHAARRLAELFGYEYAGEYAAGGARDGATYFVPDDTLLAQDAARLRIHSERDLFGGVVPYAFVATKAVTHGVVAADAQKPAGWSQRVAEAMRDVVLPGFTAFSRDDARRAARDLLRGGRVRLKRVVGLGGSGQFAAGNLDEFEAALDAVSDEELAAHGVVVERNLEEVSTYSIGRLHVAARHIAYYGVQKAVRNHRGQEVYGGSDLVVARDGMSGLLRLDMPAPVRKALAQARCYDQVISRAFPDFFSSRRNYDVACGRDADDGLHVGVLEQSWRFGGASAAEVAALEAFERDPALRVLRASTHELYGDSGVPADAIVSFRGVDAQAGAMVKYCTVETYGNPA